LYTEVTEPGIEATACARELLYVYVYVYVYVTYYLPAPKPNVGNPDVDNDE